MRCSKAGDPCGAKTTGISVRKTTTNLIKFLHIENILFPV
jgi:hypothetical protein